MTERCPACGHTLSQFWRDDGRPDILACLNCRFATDVEPARYPSVTHEGGDE